MQCGEETLDDVLANDVIINIQVLCAFMEDRIVRNVDNNFVITS